MVNDDRGQLLLVAGVLLALVIVSSAVLLNGIVAPGTSGTRGLGNELDSFNRDVEPIRNDLEGLFEETTSRDAHGEDLPYANPGDLDDAVDSIEVVLADGTAQERGSVVTVDHDTGGSLDGRVVYQRPGDSHNYTDNTQGTEWMLASGAESIPRATFNVSDRHADLGDSDTGKINVTNDTGTEVVRMLFGEEGVQVQVDTPAFGSTQTLVDCSVDATDSIVVEMRKPQNRTTSVYAVNASGQHRCGTFELGNHVAPPYDVGIANGSNLNGTYAVSLRDADPTGVGIGPSSWPRKESGGNVVVNPQFTVTYVSDGITYESTFNLYNRTEP